MYLSIFFQRITSCGLHGPCNEKMAILVQDFVQSLISKHPYWNRTQGANHFIVNCDDICWKATIRMQLLENAIQVACESLDGLEFKPIKGYCPPRLRSSTIHSSTSWKYCHIKQVTSFNCSLNLAIRQLR